jgi:hypothetical protein
MSILHHQIMVVFDRWLDTAVTKSKARDGATMVKYDQAVTYFELAVDRD